MKTSLLGLLLLFYAAPQMLLNGGPVFDARGESTPSETRIPVAFIGSYAGGDPNTSRELERGMQAFLASDGEAGRTLKIEKFDNHGSVLETLKVFDQIHEQGIDLVVGIARSDEAMAAAKAAGARGKLFITPFATHPGITQQGNSIFQICFSDSFQGRVLAEFAVRDLHAKRILVLKNSESIYSNGLATQFLESLASAAQSSVLEYTESDMRLELLLKQLQTFQPDLIFIPDHITRASLLAKAIRKFNVKVRFLGGDGFGGKKILTSIFGDSPEIELYYTTHWSSALKTSVNEKFLKYYHLANPGDEPTTGAAMSFDAFKVLWESLKEVRARQGKARWNVDPARLTQVMRGRGFDLTTGRLVLPMGAQQEIKKSAVVIQLKEGKYSVYKTLDP